MCRRVHYLIHTRVWARACVHYLILNNLFCLHPNLNAATNHRLCPQGRRDQTGGRALCVPEGREGRQPDRGRLPVRVPVSRAALGVTPLRLRLLVRRGVEGAAATCSWLLVPTSKEATADGSLSLQAGDGCREEVVRPGRYNAPAWESGERLTTKTDGNVNEDERSGD